MWILLAVCSAVFLGCYDIAKKKSLTTFSVLDVLTFSVILSCLLLIPMLLGSRWCEDSMPALLYVPRVSWQGHGFILLKSCIVLSSWLCSYVALKHLAISVVAPMQATRPMWTLVGAMLIFGERLNLHQSIGVACALGSIFLFSVWEHPRGGFSWKGEGKYYLLLIAGILLGSTSGLYDKYMMRHWDHNAVQVYYTIYQALLMGTVWLVVRRHPRLALRSMVQHGVPWSIVAISVLLVVSDFVYLLALSYPDSLIAVVSTIRRGGTIIPFLYGILILREKDPWKKIVCTLGIALGLAFLIIG